MCSFVLLIIIYFLFDELGMLNITIKSNVICELFS